MLLAPAAAAADVADYLGKPIASIRLETEGRPGVDQRLLAIIQTQVGSPLTMMAVRETIAHLFSLGEYEDVRVHASTTAAGVDLLYELAPVHPVRRILFNGITRVPAADEGRLRRAVLERFGASPAVGRAADVARLVEAELATRGYLHARATPRVELEHAPDHATLILSVDPGARTHVGAVEVVGSPGMPVAQLLERLGVATGAPYERDALSVRVEEYIADRRARGYYEARLTITPRLVDDDALVNLSLNAVQGPRVRIVFTGDPLPEDVREELVPIAREGSTDEDLLEDSTNRIVDYLRTQGYRDAATPHARVETDGELVVSFAVERGPQYRVAAINISGNVFFSRPMLEPLLRLREGQPFQAARLDADVAAIQDVYRRRGFTAVDVDPSVEPTPAGASADVPVAVRIVINEGPQTIVGSVRIEGNESVPAGDLVTRLALRAGAEFFATQMAVDRDAIQLAYANLGYLSATVESNPGLSADGTRADVVFIVREGPRVLVEHVLVVGNERTRTETIERELQIRPGDPVGFAAVTESQRRLTALGLFRRARITQLAHGDETTRDLLITVEEAPPTTVGIGGGLETSQLIRSEELGGVASQRLEFAPRAFFEITRRNLFGKNRSVNVFTRISLRPNTDRSGYGFSEYRVLGTFREPRVFDSSADAFLTAVAEQQIRSSFNFARRAFNAEVGRRVTPALSVSGSYQIQRTELFDEQFSEVDKLLIDRLFPQVLLSSFSASAIHDTRDDQLDPGAGQYFSANGQLAARRIGSEVGLVKSYLTAQMFRTVPRSHRVVLAASARLGMAVGFARDVIRIKEDGEPMVDVLKDLPASERFFAGGDTTVRGFALDQLGTRDIIDKNGFPIGGNAVVILNTELRVPLRGGLGVVGFFDSGNVFARTTDIDLGQLRNAAGFGFRYRSPIGPIRVDVGFKMNRREIVPDRPEPLNAWHITLGQAF